MDDEFLYKQLQDISSKLSSTESKVESLADNMEKMCDWKDGVLSNLQQVNDYMSARVTIPEKVEQTRKDLDRLKDKTDRDEELNKASRAKTDFLMTFWWRISGVLLVFTAINFLLVLYGNYRSLFNGGV